MAAPNIAGITTITGKTTGVTPAVTTATVLLSNAAGSGQCLRVNQVVAANVNGVSTVNATVSWNSAAAGAGTSFPVGSTVPVPVFASIIFIDKMSAIYLEENQSLVVVSGTASGIAYTVSYEILS